MKKLLKFLKCKDTNEVIAKMKNYEINEEIREFQELMKTISFGNIKRKDVTSVKNKLELIAYIRSEIGFKNTEEFKVLFISAANRIIASETLFTGTVDRSAIYPRLIVEKALKYHTKGIVFAHNHPSGDITPSKKDISLTLDMKEFLDMIDIKLLDHIIISENDHYSMYTEGFINY
ncbi:MAG: JAB domain-containing protein [Paraclostridium sp.]